MQPCAGCLASANPCDRQHAVIQSWFPCNSLRGSAVKIAMCCVAALGNKVAFPNLMRFNGAAPEGESFDLQLHPALMGRFN